MKRIVGFMGLCLVLWSAPAWAENCQVGAASGLSNGVQYSITCDTTGSQRETLSSLIAGEDQPNNVLRVEGQFSSTGNITSDTQIKASGGFVHSLVCSGTDGTATAGTIILYNNTAESGTIIYQFDVQAVAYNNPVVIPLDVVASTGLYLGFTTTADMRCTVVWR